MATPSECPAGLSSQWLQQAGEHLSQLEYQVRTDAVGIQAPNRAQNLRTYFDRDGIRVFDRLAEEKGALLSLRFVSMARGTQHYPAMSGNVQALGQQVHLPQGHGVTEWFENTAQGLEHGFHLEQRLNGEGNLILRIAVGKAELLGEQDHFRFRTTNGRELDYGKLWVKDARGHEVPSRMLRKGRHIEIHIADIGYSYPLLVDPLLAAGSNWQVESDQKDAQMGWSVSSAGDINNDGFADVLVSAITFDRGQANEGAVFVYHGSKKGLSTKPDRMLESNRANDWMGYKVAAAGDINGDDFDDVIIAVHGYDKGQFNEGAAFIYYGGSWGLQSEQDLILQTNQKWARLDSVAGAGDVNNDGFADVIIGSSAYTHGQKQEGAAMVFLGSRGGLHEQPQVILESNQVGARFGMSVAGAGDVNGDGFEDVLVGAPYYDRGQVDEGLVFVYPGSEDGVLKRPLQRIEGNQADAWLGNSVSSAGDINGDEKPDIIVAVPFHTNGLDHNGAALVFLGNGKGYESRPQSILVSERSQAWVSEVGLAGDTNHDGYSDLFVTTLFDMQNQAREGEVFIYPGSKNGISMGKRFLLTTKGNSTRIDSVAGAGDINGDDYDDVIAGITRYENGQSMEGSALVYVGGKKGFNATHRASRKKLPSLANKRQTPARVMDVHPGKSSSQAKQQSTPPPDQDTSEVMQDNQPTGSTSTPVRAEVPHEPIRKQPSRPANSANTASQQAPVSRPLLTKEQEPSTARQDAPTTQQAAAADEELVVTQSSIIRIDRTGRIQADETAREHLENMQSRQTVTPAPATHVDEGGHDSPSKSTGVSHNITDTRTMPLATPLGEDKTTSAGSADTNPVTGKRTESKKNVANISEIQLLQMGVHKDTDYHPLQNYMLIEQQGIPPGSSIPVIMSVKGLFPAQGVYRVFNGRHWMIVPDSALSSSLSSPKGCPAPNNRAYQGGLLEGMDCVQFKVKEGGPYDMDGAADGKLKLLTGLALQNQKKTAEAAEATEVGGSTYWLSMSLLLGLFWRVLNKGLLNLFSPAT